MGDGGFWNLLPSLNLVLWSNSPSFKFWVTCWEGYLFPLSQSSTSAVLRTISIHATLYFPSSHSRGTPSAALIMDSLVRSHVSSRYYRAVQCSMLYAVRNNTVFSLKFKTRLRDPASWLPLAAGASSRNLVFAF